MSTNAFTPTGNTVCIIAQTTAPNAIQVPGGGSIGSTQYMVANSGNVTVILGTGSTQAAANTAAANITTTGVGIPILAGVQGVMTFNAGTYFTAYASANAAVYITPGDGL